MDDPTPINTQENTSSMSAATKESTQTDLSNLSRHERRKLMKQQHREQQQSQQELFKKKKLTKRIINYSVIVIILVVLGYFVYSSTRTELPTIDNDPSIGPSDAKVTVIEFGDVSCPFTKAFQEETFYQIMKDYNTSVLFVYRDMPTGRHANDMIGAQAVECANDQGKYWEYQKILFQRQGRNDALSLKSYAKELNLNTDAFNACLDSGKYKDEVRQDLRDGKKAGVRMTPTLFINGYKFEGVQSYAFIKQILDSELNS